MVSNAQYHGTVYCTVLYVVTNVQYNLYIVQYSGEKACVCNVQYIVLYSSIYPVTCTAQCVTSVKSLQGLSCLQVSSFFFFYVFRMSTSLTEIGEWGRCQGLMELLVNIRSSYFTCYYVSFLVCKYSSMLQYFILVFFLIFIDILLWTFQLGKTALCIGVLYVYKLHVQ